MQYCTLGRGVLPPQILPHLDPQHTPGPRPASSNHGPKSSQTLIRTPELLEAHPSSEPTKRQISSLLTGSLINCVIRKHKSGRVLGGVQGLFQGCSGGVPGAFRGPSSRVLGMFRGCSQGVGTPQGVPPGLPGSILTFHPRPF